MTPPAELGAEPPISLRVLAACRARAWRLATAESCTGGLIAAALTEHRGSSDVLERGVVSYSNEAKIALLGVPPALIAGFGAVSQEVAAAMAEGLLERAPVAITVSVTGIAGPDGGSLDKPVGLVWFGCAVRGGAVRTERRVFAGDRAAVRAGAVAVALSLVLEAAWG